MQTVSAARLCLQMVSMQLGPHVTLSIQLVWHNQKLEPVREGYLVLLQRRLKYRQRILTIFRLGPPVVVGSVRELVQNLGDYTESCSCWILAVCKRDSYQAVSVVCMAEVLLILHCLSLTYLCPTAMTDL